MTMTQKILAAHCALDTVAQGQLIEASLDMVLGNDITAPVAINEFEKAGLDSVFSKEKIALVMDHFTPNKDIKAAEQCKQVRDFARRHGIAHFYDVGEMGVEHALLPEKGLVKAGDCIIGADSHTCTYGALGAFSTGVGSTDMAAGMAAGKAWFRVPGAIQLYLPGKPGANVSGKDLILHIIGRIGVDGALYKSMEFAGEGVASLSMDDRLCISNMAVEAGAKNGIFPVDDKTVAYMKQAGAGDYKVFETGTNADYEAILFVDLCALKPTVAFPHLPGNVKTIDQINKPVIIDQVVIGSCTNGRYEDMAAAAEVIKGKKVAAGVRCIIIPATQKVFLECVKNGLAEIFVEAGAVFSTPTCGPCLGGHMGILAEGERAVATTNRNFVGRMGHAKSEVYLASPYIAAKVALSGFLGKELV
jgi:3-isopropylmalate/(R)-2-methylmalate dehydratase large subunit